MQNKLIWGLVGLLVLSFVVLGLTSHHTPTGITTNDLSKYPVTADDHIRGNLATAKVVVVEYGDFECPACKAYAPLLKQAYEQYNGQVAIVFRHFPLIEIHQNALVGAKAAEAAGVQGKFFEMSDLLYANQNDWADSPTPEKYFDQYAQSLGLNIQQFDTDSSSQAVENLIRTERAQAEALGLQGTPSLFVNGKAINLPQSGQEFQKVIDDTIAASNTNATPQQ